MGSNTSLQSVPSISLDSFPQRFAIVRRSFSADPEGDLLDASIGPLGSTLTPETGLRSSFRHDLEDVRLEPRMPHTAPVETPGSAPQPIANSFPESCSGTRSWPRYREKTTAEFCIFSAGDRSLDGANYKNWPDMCIVPSASVMCSEQLQSSVMKARSYDEHTEDRSDSERDSGDVP